MDWKLELVAVPVSDVDRAKAFYVDQVGFTPTTTTGSATSCGSSSSRRPVGVLDRHRRGISTRRRDRWRGCSWCRRRGGCARRPRRAGVEVCDVQDFPWGRFVFFSDPDGNGWAVQQIPPRD